jgi:hypothetical protein
MRARDLRVPLWDDDDDDARDPLDLRECARDPLDLRECDPRLFDLLPAVRPPRCLRPPPVAGMIRSFFFVILSEHKSMRLDDVVHRIDAHALVW